VDGLSGAARTAKLVELARAQGGSLNLYTSSTSGYMADLAKAFDDEYGIAVSLYSASNGAIAQRLVEEDKAGFHGSDVIEENTPELIGLDHDGLLVPYDSPAIGGLVAGARGVSWIGDKFNTFVIAWNTDNVHPGEEPRSIEELADPRWKGKLGLEIGDPDWYKAVWQHLVSQGATPAEADRLFEAIARNATFVKGHSLLAQLAAAGEFDVVLDVYLHTVKQLIADGAPLAWQPAAEPVVSRADGIAVAHGTRHPAAALLFVDYTLGKGQEIFADAYLTPAR
jgi:iron(III) transport system substrate-binding protein